MAHDRQTTGREGGHQKIFPLTLSLESSTLESLLPKAYHPVCHPQRYLLSDRRSTREAQVDFPGQAPREK